MDVTQQIVLQQAIMNDGPSSGGGVRCTPLEFLVMLAASCLLSFLVNWLFFWPKKPTRR